MASRRRDPKPTHAEVVERIQCRDVGSAAKAAARISRELADGDAVRRAVASPAYRTRDRAAIANAKALYSNALIHRIADAAGISHDALLAQRHRLAAAVDWYVADMRGMKRDRERHKETFEEDEESNLCDGDVALLGKRTGVKVASAASSIDPQTKQDIAQAYGMRGRGRPVAEARKNWIAEMISLFVAVAGRPGFRTNKFTGTVTSKLATFTREAAAALPDRELRKLVAQPTWGARIRSAFRRIERERLT
jgi:hypothetical protein